MRIFTFLCLCFFTFPLFGQLNVSLVSHLSYELDSTRANDIWGYVSPDGTEYALVGFRDFVSIVSLENPANPKEVARIPGEHSTWRDLKTWGEFAYITTDAGGTREGITVIDLSNLPNSADFYHWTPVIAAFEDTLFTCHNLYIDEVGYAYLAGCNLNGGGMLMLDVFSEPGVPKYVGAGAAIYSHDVFVQDEKMYASELLEGRFAIYDVSDRTAPELLGAQTTPFEFTHNAWVSEDGNTLFATDEKANAPTSAYDISAPTDIRYLDEFRPIATLGQGVIPHNVHVLDDYLVTSHYTDGLIIVDASRPQNLIEVGNYDTHFQNTSGFNGAWGAYPYLPSGLILVSDIQGGLFIFEADYQRACWLEGKITDMVTGSAIQGAKLEIQSPNPNKTISDLLGNYQTGQSLSGTFEVKVQAIKYFDATVEAVLENGQITILDIQMEPLPIYSVTGEVVEKENGIGIEGATIFLENQDLSFTTTSNLNGNFELPVITGEYTIYIGKWGYENLGFSNQTIEVDQTLRYELAVRYEDNFNLDLGWQVSGDASDGFWERGLPIGTLHKGKFSSPPLDREEDFENHCYVTGNGAGISTDDDVDGGMTILTSPVMDLTTYNRPLVSYFPWYYNPGSDSNPANDSLVISITNGREEVVLEVFDDSQNKWRNQSEFDLAQFIDITDQMQIRFNAFDKKGAGHIVEAGLDVFSVRDSLNNEAFTLQDDLVKFRIYPNPFHNEIFIDYKVERTYQKLEVLIFNILGQKIEQIPLERSLGTVALSPSLAAGTYLVVFRLDDRVSDALKIIKGR